MSTRRDAPNIEGLHSVKVILFESIDFEIITVF